MKKFAQVTYPVKGLYLDGQASTQPENTYRYALNAANDSTEGEKGFIANELGNISAFELDSKVIIGHLALADDEVILFVVSPTTSLGEIGKVDKFNNYTTILISSSLEFSVDNQVEATISTIKGCERIIYFCSPRLYALNIDSLEQYLLPGETVTTANDTGTGWDIDLIKLFPAYTRSTISNINILETGGTLPLGTYNVVASYSKTATDVVGWMDFSMSIPIVDESYAEEFKFIDGGLNSVVPPTSKAIEVTFDNLDTTFPYLKIAVIANNDSVRTAYILDTVELLAESMSYTITGIDSENAISVPINELTVGKAVYEEAKTINQIDNRLLIGNLVEKNIDLSKFQQKANDIKTHWFCKELNPEVTESSSKSTSTYLDYRSYMSDEVYSLGIVYLFNDGYETPAFHIPGREANLGYLGDTLPEVTEPNIWHNRPLPQGSWDTTNLFSTVDIPYDDLEHILSTPFEDIGYGPGLVPRWKAVNTAIRFETPSEGYFAEGEMAYWESELDYPSTVDCNGTRIYPEDKIRHHKFPDNILVPHAVYYPSLDTSVNTWRVYPLGIKFTSIEYPAEYADEIIGYKIVREQRNKSNTSVHDKGLLTTCLVNYAEQHLVQPFPYNNKRHSIPTAGIVEPKHVTFHSPLVKFTRNYIGASHLKIEQKLISAPFTGGEFIDILSSGPVEYRSTARFSVSDSNSAFISTDVLNRKIRNQGYLDSDSILENYFDYTFNNTEQQEAYVISTVSDVPLPSALIDVFPYNEGLLDNLEIHFYYCGLNSYLPSQYGQISSGVYISCFSNYETSDSCEVYGGDVFISRLYFKKHAAFEDGVPVNDGVGTPDSIDSNLISFFAESTINCGLRHEGTEDSEVYYPKSYSADVDSFLDLERTVNGTIDSDLIPNYYAYNTDYSKENDVKIYLPVSQAFDYCSTCSHDYHTRIAYSEQKSLESIADSFNTFLLNNYRDLPQNKGDIIKLFVQDHNLYAHLENTLYQVPTNTQRFTSTDSDVFVGANAFMAIEPVEVKSINEGYLGTKHQWAHITTELGTLFISEEKIFLLGEGLFEISNQGMRRFFIDNKLRFPDAFRELLLSFASTLTTEFTFPDSPASHRGVGWLACYDRVNHRVILHKKDYDILFTVGSVENPIGFWGIKNPQITYIDGSIVLNSTTGWFEQYNATEDLFIELYLTDTDLFENKSITLSYDLEEKHWISFHSYLPQYIFNTYNKWFSTQVELSTRVIGFTGDYGAGLNIIQIFNTSAYQHNKGNYLQYYDNYYDHIIELVSKETPLASTIKSVGFTGLTREYNSTHRQWMDVPNITFTKAWLYNDTQSTGLLNTVVTNGNSDPFISITYSPSQVYLFKADKAWRLNAFRDFTITPATVPFSTSSWANLQSSYYIDKLPLAAAHDNTQSQYTVKKFRDKYINTRYYFTPNTINNYKILTQFAFTNQKESVR